MSAITHFFVPVDEFEDNELTSGIGGQLASLLAGMAGLHVLSELIHFLDVLGSLQLNPPPSATECMLATQFALSNGSLSATPLGDRRGIWVPIAWLPDPTLDCTPPAPHRASVPAPTPRDLRCGSERRVAPSPAFSGRAPRTPWPSFRPRFPW